jgi:single-strand DNA-binding protein
MTNVAVLVGRLARPAEPKELPSGDRLVSYEVTVPSDTGRAESVPVVWFGAPASAGDYDVDEKVVVVGRVRRRFFRTPAGTQSRTEVVADAVVPARQAKRARAALEKARDSVPADAVTS